MIWGDRAWQRDLVALVGDDPGIDQVLVFYDHPPGLDGAIGRELAGGRGRHPRRRRREPAPPCSSPPPSPSCSTTPPPGASPRPACPPSPASAPASPAPPPCRRPPPDAERLREIAAACRRRAGHPAAGRPRGSAEPGLRPPALAPRWLAEHETKALLRAAGIPVVDGRVVAGEDDAVAALAELGGPVAVKLSSPELQHKTAAGALALDVAGEPALRAAHRALASRNGGAQVLVERMAPPGAELIVAVRRDAVVPALVIGLGGIHAEAFDDVAVVPLPATPERVAGRARDAPRRRRCSGTPTSPPPPASRPRSPHLPGLELIECNPVLVHEQGAVVVDAVAKESHDMNAIAQQLGEVGLPAPVKELAARHWDAVVVGGGHNGLTCAAYLAKAGQSVLVLERRERLGGACTLERPFSDPELHRQPVRLRRRPARRRRDPGARPQAARPPRPHRRPQPVGPVRGRHLLRPVGRRRPHPGRPRRSSASPRRTRRATGPTSTSSTRSGSGCAPASATAGSATRRAAPSSRSCCTASRR